MTFKKMLVSSGCALRRRGNKLLLMGQMLAVDHQYQHDVVGGISAANHAVAQRSLAAIFLVSMDVELAGKITPRR